MTFLYWQSLEQCYSSILNSNKKKLKNNCFINFIFAVRLWDIWHQELWLIHLCIPWLGCEHIEDAQQIFAEWMNKQFMCRKFQMVSLSPITHNTPRRKESCGRTVGSKTSTSQCWTCPLPENISNIVKREAYWKKCGFFFPFGSWNRLCPIKNVAQ